MIKFFLKKVKPVLPAPSAPISYEKKSYSQSGEDLIVKYILDLVGISQPTYIDVGAHHPFYLSNTALFYSLGCRGINIEPDPILFKEFVKCREQDINLNIGIAEKKGELDFFIISSPTLNTFSKKEAQRYKEEGEYEIVKTEKVEVDTINSIVDKYAKGKYPDFLNLDAEGVDDIILQSINFEKNSPAVICVETISFSNSGRGVKNTSLINFLQEKGYLLYADTNINSIFVRRNKWER